VDPVYVAGESSNQLYIWLPDDEVLLIVLDIDL